MQACSNAERHAHAISLQMLDQKQFFGDALLLSFGYY